MPFWKHKQKGRKTKSKPTRVTSPSLSNLSSKKEGKSFRNKARRNPQSKATITTDIPEKNDLAEQLSWGVPIHQQQ